MEKIDAVREIVQRNGRLPAATLQTGTASDMGIAEEFLDQEELAHQERGWHYNTRSDVTLSPVLFTFDNAAWTHATKTLTQTGAFEDATVGQSIEITAGAVAGIYTVSTVVSDDAITTEEDIGSDIDIASGIAGAATNNKIVVPAAAISIDTYGCDAGRDFTQRGGRILDLANNVDLFTRGYKFTYIERVDWGCITFAVRRYLMLKAAIRFSEHYETAQYGSIRNALREAEARVFARDGKLKGVNFLHTNQSRRARGWRRGEGLRDPGDIRYGS